MTSGPRFSNVQLIVSIVTTAREVAKAFPNLELLKCVFVMEIST